MPSATLFGKRDWGYVLLLAPRWFDFFNVGGCNFLEGKFWNLSYFRSRIASWELTHGIPIIICLSDIIRILFVLINRSIIIDTTMSLIVFFPKFLLPL